MPPQAVPAVKAILAELLTGASGMMTWQIGIVFLVGAGLVMVYSASSHLASGPPLQDSYFYFKKQALFCMLGFIMMILAKNIPCILYSKLVYGMMLISLFLLIMLLIPGIGHKVGGATRWLRLGGLSFQPSEFVKLSLAVYMAYSMAKKGSYMESFSNAINTDGIYEGSSPAG